MAQSLESWFVARDADGEALVFEDYCERVRSSNEWGRQLELRALALHPLERARERGVRRRQRRWDCFVFANIDFPSKGSLENIDFSSKGSLEN